MAPPDVAKGAAALTANAPRKTDRHPGLIDLIVSGDQQRKQCLCEHCGRALLPRSHGSPGRVRRFCSARCQKAAVREKAVFAGSRYNLPRCPEIGSKSPVNSTACQAKNGHLCPSPIDILGGSKHRRRKAHLNPDLWASILRCEVGGQWRLNRPWLAPEMPQASCKGARR